MMPFNGTPCPFIIKKLTYAQIRSCGEFSLIETVQDIVDGKKKPSVKQMYAYAEMQHSLVKKALVSPSYDEIMSKSGIDEIRINAEKELEEIDLMIKELPLGPKRRDLEDRRDTIKMQIDFILPADFLSAVISYSLDIDSSDIKEVTEEMLYEAAIRAKNGAGNPSDHLPGNFTEFNCVDINNRSWAEYYKRQKKG
jgi:hypothetical protein